MRVVCACAGVRVRYACACTCACARKLVPVFVSNGVGGTKLTSIRRVHTRVYRTKLKKKLKGRAYRELRDLDKYSKNLFFV